MSGKLIFVSGLTGAGKTTLIEAALKRIKNIEPLLTYTTRPMRLDEEHSHEYLFVNDKEYELAKSKSRNWDETIFNTYKYASDGDIFINHLSRGVNVIVSVTPNMDNITLMTAIYKTEPITIWVNTDTKTAYNRIKNDPRRNSRAEDESIKSNFDIIYNPSGNMDDDIETFTQLIENVII